MRASVDVGVFGRGVEDDSAADCSLRVGVKRVVLSSDKRPYRVEERPARGDVMLGDTALCFPRCSSSSIFARAGRCGVYSLDHASQALDVAESNDEEL